MKLSGHSYDNDVMGSLLDGITKDVVFTKAAHAQNNTRQEEPEVSGMDIFSSVTESDFRGVQNEELANIIGELEFAADRAHVGIARAHVIAFAKEAMNDGLRGKKLERAAQKFCNRIATDSAPPIGDTRNSLSANLLDNANDHAVIPAGYNTEHGQSDSKTGGYMGQSMNPNSIWDSGKLAELAAQPRGDEQIKQSQAAKEKFAANQKQQYWEELQQKLAHQDVIQGKTASVANVSTVEHVGNQKMPENSMDIWGNDGFAQLPERTVGESIKQSEEEVAMKKQAARKQWDKSEPATKAASQLLDEVIDEPVERKSIHRASVDKLFDGLADYYNGK